MEREIIPIIKKEKRVRVENYRGVTLMSTLYIMYMRVLAERIKEEVERKGLSRNQTGFRKELGAIDNIYVINYLVHRQLVKKGESLVALFVDLKAAFDSVDRRLLEAIKEREIKAKLVGRMEEALKETRSRVGVESEAGEDFWTAREVRQGCPLSPLLFNVLIADLEEKMGRVK